MHAVLCRAWGNRPKGRDWYDLVWYIGKGVNLDLEHLQARLNQSCSFLDKENINIPRNLSHNDLINLLEKRLINLDVNKAKSDVLPFIKDYRELDLWSTDFFLQVIKQIKSK